MKKVGRSSIQKVQKIVPIVLLLGFLKAQLPTTDAAAQAAIQQSNAQRMVEHGEVLGKWADDLKKLDTQIDWANKQFDRLDKLMNVAGDPAGAVEAVGGTGVFGSLGSSIQNSKALQLSSKLAKTASGATSLARKGEGIYEDIKSNSEDGSSILRDPKKYLPFDAFEKEHDNFLGTTEETLSELQSLEKEIDSTVKASTSTEAEQRQKLAKLEALNAKVQAIKSKTEIANMQRQARFEANQVNEKKQGTAAVEEDIQEGKKRDKEDSNLNKKIMEKRK